eukprot:TRINITY_DN15856_c0_g2_i2.p1 TRINITY_DN15856_c0_g2~~TRINITY_DN15856_c0_g2_i2.p1  ORF type:complete len:123 (-),score=13.93 TRINITY_DN15856_c0_g2_i2:367-735(-)
MEPFSLENQETNFLFAACLPDCDVGRSATFNIINLDISITPAEFQMNEDETDGKGQIAVDFLCLNVGPNDDDTEIGFMVSGIHTDYEYIPIFKDDFSTFTSYTLVVDDVKAIKEGKLIVDFR